MDNCKLWYLAWRRLRQSGRNKTGGECACNSRVLKRVVRARSVIAGIRLWSRRYRRSRSHILMSEQHPGICIAPWRCNVVFSCDANAKGSVWGIVTPVMNDTGQWHGRGAGSVSPHSRGAGHHRVRHGPTKTGGGTGTGNYAVQYNNLITILKKDLMLLLITLLYILLY